MKTELLAWLIDATVATSIAGIAILLLRKPLQRWLGAEIAYRLWTVLPLAVLAACFSLPQATLIASDNAQQTFTAAPAVIVRVASSLGLTELGSIDADRWLLAIWLGGACVLLAMLIWQQRRFVARLCLRRSVDGSWRSGMSDATPAVLGVLRQKLVLPECFESDFSDDEQQLVIAHERMHQQRRDPWALAICALLRTLFWFNPIVHFAATHFRRDVELACDAAVLRAHPGSRRRYADALLKTQLVDRALPVGCHWHHTPPMKERIMLLKNALPARRARLAGAILMAVAALGTTGIAMAGHDSAFTAASALAATTPMPQATPYMVKLTMSVDGKPVAHPAVITRAGETAMVRIDENGVAWGMRFHLDPKSGSNGVVLSGDVFTNSEQHVIGHAQLAETAGTPLVITMHDKADARSYRIDAQITIAPPPSPRADRSMRSKSHASASATAAPGARREIEIVRNGTSAPDGAVDADDIETVDIPGEAMAGDTPAPGARREVRREVTVRAPADGAGNDQTHRVERKVIIETDGDGTLPPPPLPPLPPLPPVPHAMHAVLPPAPPPGAMTQRMKPPPAPPAPPQPLDAPVPPAPPLPPPPPSN